MKNKNKLKRCLDYLRNNRDIIAKDHVNLLPCSKESVLLTYLKEFRLQLAGKYDAHFCEFFIDEYGERRNICSSIIQVFFPFDKGNNYKEIYTLIKSYFTFEVVLKKKIKTLLLPNVALVFDWKIADCADLCTIVVSALRTKNYDAYVVCGEAPFSICAKDDKNNLCEFNFKDWDKYEGKKEDDAPELLDIKGKKAKYRKLMNMGVRAAEERKFEDDGSNDEKDLYLHMWILIKKSLDVKKDVFIEMGSGREYDVDDCPYRSIFYLWNEKNVYVNIRKTEEVATLVSELQNNEYFVPAFYDEIRAKALTPIIENRLYKIRKDRFLLKYPQGSNTTFYKNCKRDQYGDFQQHDGLTEMHTHYGNKFYTSVESVCCLFKYRRDGKKAKLYFPQKFKTVEYYDSCGHHFLKALRESIGFYSHFSFYPNRPDGLVHYLEIKDSKIMEYFSSRNDQVTYRSMCLSPSVRTNYKLQMFDGKEYYVIKMTVKYKDERRHNGIRKKIFLIPENKIILVYYNNCNEISNTFEVYDKHIWYNPDTEENEEIVTYKKNYVYKHFVNYGDPLQKETLYLLREERSLFDDIESTYKGVICAIRKERRQMKEMEEEYQYGPQNIINKNEMIYHDNEQMQKFNKSIIEDEMNVSNFNNNYPWDQNAEISMNNSFFLSKRRILKIECACDEIAYVSSEKGKQLARPALRPVTDKALPTRTGDPAKRNFKIANPSEGESDQNRGTMKLSILEDRLAKYKRELSEMKDVNDPSNLEDVERIKKNIKFTEDRIYHCRKN
ncbi:hypothetical protein C922_03485 [Plasmodium inui San Antonio 1]|uniref:Dynein regulatory complex subunit 7 MORN domain-containing protein n=1 Tax=Plasmodium inui San Antonio 1 TaxID=1237626 RepID=W7A2Y4_9APIC|nr:hypothetical protein C922_03485 [Plasmodium inui San Antonio 1]EUD66015.1 hypothetical protein C922_03485 [Plasmodium inui San Antonio 1]